MKKRNVSLIGGAVAGAVLVLAAIPAVAHHSFAMFDQARTVKLSGTVTQFQWTNPHSFIELEVPAKGGGSEHWSIELNSPNNLTRQGWKRTSIKPGDKVTVTINPLRDGKKGGLFSAIILPDGRMLGDRRGADGKPINVPTAN
ncbi:MAG: DUF6152 family protein [Sphingomonas sp.]